ncbi:MAG: hypothetical protein ABR567_22640 [Myxococcales bacterium]|nr:hypothetical protein [Myxococcales bacterium]
MRRAILLAALACAHAEPQRSGLTKENAVEVCLPPGEKAFLDQWRCPGGSKPQHHRLGSIGTRMQPVDPNDPRILLQMDPERPLERGEPDFHIVDAVEMRCAGATYTVFIDMYHCG